MIHSSKFLGKFVSGLVLCLVAVSISLSGGCGLFKKSHAPQVFIPLQKTAKEQFVYALDHRQKNDLILRNKEQPARASEARVSIRSAFEMVVVHFPEDLEVTPMAKLELAKMQAGMDQTRTTPRDSDVRKAISEFQKIRMIYPELEFIQAEARFDEAMCWKVLKDYEKAQALFKEVADNYADSEDADVKRLVQVSQIYYQQTYVK